MGESGGGSLTGPRLHQVSGLARTWERPKNDCRRRVEEAQDEGLRLQPGVRRQLLSANDPVHQPQGHLWTVLKEGRRLPTPQRRSHLCKVHQHAVQRQVLCQAQPGPVPHRCSQNTDQGVEWDHSDGQSEPDEEHSDKQTATSYTPRQCQHSIQPHQTAEGGASRPGGGQPLHQRALHREDRQPQAFWARCRGQRLPVPQPAASEGLRQPDQTCLTMPRCQKINPIAILLINLMMAAVRMTTFLICNLAKFIQLKDDGHEDSADLLCDRLPIVLLARYRLHNQLCNFKHLCSASKLYKSYSIE